MTYHIPAPCPASWNAMTPSGNGRHCATCDKVVVDVTAMAPPAAKAFLAIELPQRLANGDHVCVRAHADRRQRLLRPSQRLLTNALAGILAATMFGALAGLDAADAPAATPTTSTQPATTPQAMGEVEAQILSGKPVCEVPVQGDVMMGAMVAVPPTVTAVKQGDSELPIDATLGIQLGALLQEAAGRFQADLMVPRIAPSHVLTTNAGESFSILMDSLLLGPDGALNDHELVQRILDLLPKPASE